MGNAVADLMAGEAVDFIWIDSRWPILNLAVQPHPVPPLAFGAEKRSVRGP